jgi:anion-transporting  ArsA/GET3 family ATPase
MSSPSNYTQEGGYYTATGPLPSYPAISLTDPSNLFMLQNSISNNLNAFETTYTRYVRCQDPNVQSQVQPACNVNGSDSFNSLQRAYTSLAASIQDMSNAIATQVHTDPNTKTTTEYAQNTANLPTDYASIVQFRKDLDKQLQLLYMQMDKTTNTSEANLRSTMYINTLWIILATCLLYYIFIEL